MNIARFVVAALLVPSLALAEDKAVTDQEIRQTVDSHMSDLKACMQQHGAATGKLVVEFTIQPDGKVSDSKVGTASSNGKLDACIASGFKKWSFPKPRGGKLWVSAYPITFSVPKEAPKGTLAESDIVGTIQGKMAEVKACYDENKGTDDKAAAISGITEVGVVVSPAGKVTEVKILSSTTKSPKLDQCVVAHVKTWAFPKPQGGGEAAFRYPFKFNVK
jgi:TonB family protein